MPTPFFPPPPSPPNSFLYQKISHLSIPVVSPGLPPLPPSFWWGRTSFQLCSTFSSVLCLGFCLWSEGFCPVSISQQLGKKPRQDILLLFCSYYHVSSFVIIVVVIILIIPFQTHTTLLPFSPPPLDRSALLAIPVPRKTPHRFAWLKMTANVLPARPWAAGHSAEPRAGVTPSREWGAELSARQLPTLQNRCLTRTLHISPPARAPSPPPQKLAFSTSTAKRKREDGRCLVTVETSS